MNFLILFIVSLSTLSMSSCRKAFQPRSFAIENFSKDKQSLSEHYRSRLVYKNRFFNPQTIKIQDKLGYNYLYTGAPPFIEYNGHVIFAYDELCEALTNKFLEENPEISEDCQFKLIVISLLNKEKERYLIDKETIFFNQYPDRGSFLSYPIYGSFLSINCFPEMVLTEVKNTYSIDNLKNRLQVVRSLLSEKSSTRYFIYIHDAGEADRTYEFISAYKMTYLGKNLQEVLQEGKERSTFSKYALGWYNLDKSRE